MAGHPILGGSSAPSAYPTLAPTLAEAPDEHPLPLSAVEVEEMKNLAIEAENQFLINHLVGDGDESIDGPILTGRPIRRLLTQARTRNDEFLEHNPRMPLPRMT